MLEVAQILSHFIHIMLVFPWCFSGASVVLNSRGLGPKGLRRGKGGSNVYVCIYIYTYISIVLRKFCAAESDLALQFDSAP